MEPTSAYWIRFYGNKASVVWSSVEHVHKSFHVEHSLAEARKRTYCGYLSKAAQTVIHKRLFGWMEAVRIGNHVNHKTKSKDRRSLIFITLTLSSAQRHDDRWIKKNMLELFIKRMQSKFGIENYFWKAEAQKNGNLHFHLITDVYIPMTFIQSNWNEVQRSHGYLDHYFSVNGHYNAPSTHVRELSAMLDGIGYAMKYCKKDTTSRPIKGSIFRFSDSLLDVTIPPVMISPEHEEEWKAFCCKYVVKVVKEDFWTALFFNTRARGFKQPAFIAKETFSYYLSIYNYLYNDYGKHETIEEVNDRHFKVCHFKTAEATVNASLRLGNSTLQEKRNSSSHCQQAARPAGLQLRLLEFSRDVSAFKN